MLLATLLDYTLIIVCKGVQNVEPLLVSKEYGPLVCLGNQSLRTAMTFSWFIDLSCSQVLANKTNSFRLRLSYHIKEESLKRPGTDLREKDEDSRL